MRVTWRYGFKRAQITGTAPKKRVPWSGELWGINLEGEKVVQTWHSHKPLTLSETVAVMHTLVDSMREEIGAVGVDCGWWVACR